MDLASSSDGDKDITSKYSLMLMNKTVKRWLSRSSKDGNAIGVEIQFQTEVEMISLVVHRNLLCQYGFCMTAIERLLVYPYKSNGSVASL
ncbi:hypothetical protein RIF29_29017 [Crotalaria pallida]|uniref:non-specific serine/threonine protein kinase n=1 Tax=Crotalaria pallida TaxID=3830 RepID=A0AAN9EEQ0_CROPI